MILIFLGYHEYTHYKFVDLSGYTILFDDTLNVRAILNQNCCYEYDPTTNSIKVPEKSFYNYSIHRDSQTWEPTYIVNRAIAGESLRYIKILPYAPNPPVIVDLEL